MPQFVAAAALVVTDLFAEAAIAFGTSAATAEAFAIAATNGLFYAAEAYTLNAALGAVTHRGKTGETRGMEISINDTTADARVIYGTVRVGGVNMLPPYVSGTNGEYLHQVIALALHECDAISAVYFDQEAVGTIGAVTGSSTDGAVSTGTYSGKTNIRRYLGTMTQTVDFIINAAFPTQWPSTARGRGVTYVALRYYWGDGKTWNGLPVPTFIIRGAKVYDPRLDSTNGGAGAHRYATPSTWAYSSNPALCWANYKISSYGFGLDPATEIDWPSVSTAADACDAVVNIPGSLTEARYSIAGVLINAQDALRDNERKIIDAMVGRMTFVNGKWSIYAGGYTTPAYSIAKADWLGIDSIQTVSGADAGRINEVHGFFVDPNRNYQRVECYPRRNATYLSDDAGETLAVETELPMVQGEYQAQRICEFILRQSRNGIKMGGTLPPRFHKIKTYDTVTLTFDELGWTSKVFRVSKMELNGDGSVKVALTEEQSTDWTDLAAGDYTTISTAAVPAVNPTTPTITQNYGLRSLAGMILHDWDPPVVLPRNTRYQVIAAANCYDASVGSVVWEGDADFASVPWTVVASLTWWWTRAYVNSAYGPYNPNTYGLVGIPAPAPHTLRYPIADPQFAAGVSVGSYWSINSLDGGFYTPADNQGIYNATGAAYLVKSPGRNWSVTPDRRSIPGEGAATAGRFGVSPGQWLNYTVAFKRNTAVAATSGNPEINFYMAATRYPPGDIAYFVDLVNTFARVDTLSINQWSYIVGSVQIPTTAQWAYADVGLYNNNISSGTIVVGRFDITIS